MQCVTNLQESELVIKSTLVRKLSTQAYEEVCNHSRDYNFLLEQMDVALQCIEEKFEHANLVMGERTNVKSVEAKRNIRNRKVINQLAPIVQAITKL